MSYPSKRVQLKELNPHLMCVLCGGYLVQATTVVECLHSFCKSCILNFLETSDVCPICDVKVHKSWPLMNIRLDQTLQSLVYKMVPGLFQDEMRKRREYHWTVSDSYVKSLNLEERGDAVMEKELTVGCDHISLVLQMVSRQEESSSSSSLQVTDQRYLLCPAEFTIGLLKKFVRMKFDLTLENKIVMYKAKEELTDDLMLQDVAYIYSWKMDKPLHLFYSVGKNPFARKCWSHPTKKSSTLTPVSTAIGTFLAREESPPNVNSVLDTKTLPKLLSPSKESVTKSQTSQTNKKTKSSELSRNLSSLQSAVAKVTLSSSTSSSTSSLQTFPSSSLTVSTSSSKCMVTYSSLTTTTTASLSSPLPSLISHKNSPERLSSSTLPLSSPQSSPLIASKFNLSTLPISSSSSKSKVLQTNVSASLSSTTITSAKRKGATSTPGKSLPPGSKKSPISMDEVIQTGTPTVISTQSLMKNISTHSNPLPNSKNCIFVHDSLKRTSSKTLQTPVSEYTKVALARSSSNVSSSNCDAISSYKTTITSATMTVNSPVITTTKTVPSTSNEDNRNNNLSQSTSIPNAASRIISTALPKNKVKVNLNNNSATSKKSSVDINNSPKIETSQSSAAHLLKANMEVQIKHLTVPISTTPSSPAQSSRGRKPKQQLVSASPTVKTVSSPRVHYIAPSDQVEFNSTEGNKVNPILADEKSKFVSGKSQQKPNNLKAGNYLSDNLKQCNSRLSKNNLSNNKNDSSNKFSHVKSSVPQTIISSSSSSSSSLSSPLSAKSSFNTGRIIHSVESILSQSPSPKQELSKVISRTDLPERSLPGSKEKPICLDRNVPKDLNEVTAQFVTSVWKEAFGHTISNNPHDTNDNRNSHLLDTKQKVQSTDPSKIPAKFTSKSQKSPNGNENSLKRRNKDVDIVSVSQQNCKTLTGNTTGSISDDRKIENCQKATTNIHDNKMSKETQMLNKKNIVSPQCSPIPLAKISKVQQKPPVLHKSISCDDSQPSSTRLNTSGDVSPLEKRNWKKRKLSEIDQELSSPSAFQTHSPHLHQPGVKKRCLTPDITTKAVVDKFGRYCDTSDDKEPQNNPPVRDKDTVKDSVLSSFPHSLPSSSSLLSPLHSSSSKQEIAYHHHLQLQNYLHYHHFYSSKAQLSPISMTASSSLKTSTDDVVTTVQSSLNSRYLSSLNSSLSKQTNNNTKFSFPPQVPITSNSSMATSHQAPVELPPGFYAKPPTTLSKHNDNNNNNNNNINNKPSTTSNHLRHDRNNNMNIVINDNNDNHHHHHQFKRKVDKNYNTTTSQAFTSVPLDRQISTTSSSSSLSFTSPSKQNYIQPRSCSNMDLDSQQGQHSTMSRLSTGQNNKSIAQQQQQLTSSSTSSTNTQLDKRKISGNVKKMEQDITHNISIDVSSSNDINSKYNNNNNNTISNTMTINNNTIIVSVPESSLSSPSQTSPNNSSCTMMTSPRSSLTSPGTDATSPGTEDRPDNSVLPVECRTSCEEGGTPPYAMAAILTTSVSSKPSTPLDLTNKPRKVQ